MSKALEKVVNIAVLVACAAIIYQVGMSAYRSRVPSKVPPYTSGTLIRDNQELNLAAAHRTLILVTSSHCHFCQASIPSFKRLTEKAHSVGIRVIAAAAEEAKANEDYLRQNGLHIDHVVALLQSSLVIHGTPTLIVVDDRGRVIDSWQGMVDASSEAKIASDLN